MKRLVLICIPILLFWAGGWAQPVPLTGEIQTETSLLNEPWSHYTDFSMVDLNDNGDKYVITWHNPLAAPINNSGRVFARVFNADGTPATPEILVTTNENAWLVGRCAIDNAGNFVVTYYGDVGSSNLYFKVYDPSGNVTAGPVLITNIVSTGIHKHDLIVDNQGSFYVQYSTSGNSVAPLYIRKYSLSGSSLIGPTLIETSPSPLRSSNLVWRNDGNLVAAYSTVNVKYIVFNPSLGIVTPLTTIVTPNLYSGPTILDPGLVVKPNNNFTITFNQQVSSFPNHFSTHIQHFDPSGTPLGAATPIGALDWVYNIAGNASGNYVMAWALGSDVFAQEYSPTDALVGSQVTVNQTQSAYFRYMDVAECKLVVDWNGDGYNPVPTTDPMHYRNRVFSISGVEPTPSFTLPAHVCAGQPVPFDGTASLDETQYAIAVHQTSGFGTTNIIATLYQGNFTGTAGTLNLATLAAFQAGNWYMVTLQVKNECSQWETLTHWIYIDPLPTANATEDRVICADGWVVIGAPGQAGHTYSWSPTGTLSNPNIAQPVAYPMVTTTYTLTVTNTSTGCQKTDQVTVFVDNPGAPTIVASPSPSCVGSPVCFSVQPLSAPGTTYTWIVDYINQNGTSTPVYASGPNPCHTYTTPGKKTVTLTVVNACGTFTRTLTFSVATSPAVTINRYNPAYYCDGPQLSAVVTGGTAPYTYSWCCGLGTSSAVIVSPLYSSNYSVTVTDANGCTGTATIYSPAGPYRGPFSFTTPVQNVFTPNNDNNNDEWCLRDGAIPVFAYNATWYKIRVYTRWGVLIYTESNFIPNYFGFSSPSICWDGRNQSGVLLGDDEYDIIYTLENCERVDEYLQTVYLADGSNKAQEGGANSDASDVTVAPSAELVLYPNPSSNQVSILAPEEVASLQSVRVMNMAGVVMMSVDLASSSIGADGQIVLPIAQLPAGSYWVEVRGTTTWRRSLVKL